MSKSIHIQSEITGIRLQLNQMFLSLFKRLQMKKFSSKKSNNLIEFSLHLKNVSIVICDSVPGR